MSTADVTISGLPPGRYFTATEFACHDGEAFPIMWADRWIPLRDLCDAIRGFWGGPLSVVSGYRSPAYNQHLIDADAAVGVHGVASGSFHQIGQAADLRPALCTPERVKQLHIAILAAYEAGAIPALGGLGIYEQSGWCHVDTHKADDGHLRQWVGR